MEEFKEKSEEKIGEKIDGEIYAYLCISCIFLSQFTPFCRDLRTFSADFLKLKSMIPQTLSFSECIYQRKLRFWIPCICIQRTRIS